MDENMNFDSWSQFCNSDTKVIIPANKYNAHEDTRLLIPFIKSCKIGFTNRHGEIIIKPEYDLILDDCYSDSDYIRVGITYGYAYERKNNEPSVYIRKKWGLINSKGELVLEPIYGGIIISNNSLIVSKTYGRDYDGAHALLNKKGEVIIPFEKYRNIEPFENGLARCCISSQNNGENKELYGLINEAGEEVLECLDRYVPYFYGKYYGRNFQDVKNLIKRENPYAFNKYFPDENTDKSENEVLNMNYLKYLDACKNNKIQVQKYYGCATIVELKNGEYGVLKDGKCVVPFGKYDWIDCFDNGLARVRTRKDFRGFAKWGIINDDGKEVVPLIYDEIWNFYGKKRSTTNVVLNGETTEINLNSLRNNGTFSNTINQNNNCEHFSSYNHKTTYGEFAGSYAQDIAGYSDDTINDAFEGDPDAYWNID